MDERIEVCAARVVSLLGEKHLVNVLLIPELLGERSVLVYQALGWLAHEGRIRYMQKHRQSYVSLNGAEEGRMRDAGDA